jgi:ribosome biogenesis GTPase
LKRVLPGVVVACHGRHYLVRLEDGHLLHCFPRGKKSNLACGDRVTVERTAPDQGVMAELAPRASLFFRSDEYREKLIAANVTQVVVVVATEPGFSDELMSRCLVAAEEQRIRAAIVLNKVDLAAHLAAARALLEPFRRAGYAVVELSAKSGAAALAPLLHGQTSILVGQSGMGKSTLVNALVPDARAATREISAALDSGKHTTTFSRLYRLDRSSALIDSPGLQVFGLAHLSRQDVETAFPEFRPYLGNCRFRDCRHDTEPGCALRAAVQQGELDARRLGHFHAIASELSRHLPSGR